MMKVFVLEKTGMNQETFLNLAVDFIEKIDLKLYEDFASFIKDVVKNMPEILVFNIQRPIKEYLNFCQRLKSNTFLRTTPVIFILPKNISEGQVDMIINSGANLVLKNLSRENDLYVHLRTLIHKKSHFDQITHDYRFEQRNLIKQNKRLESRVNKFVKIFHLTPFGMFLFDEDFRLITFNRHLVQIFGAKHDQIIEIYEHLKTERGLGRIEHGMKSKKTMCLETDIDFDYLHTVLPNSTTRTGKIHLDVQISPIPIGKGEHIFLVFMNDITSKKQFEEQNRKLELAVQQSPNPIVITDQNGAIEFVNPQFSNLTGYTYEESIGNDAGFLKSGNKTKEEYKKLWNTLKAGKIWKGEFLNKKKNGTVYHEEAIISPIFNENGVITNFMGIKQDISERKAKEEKIRMLTESINQSPTGILITNTNHEIEYINKRFLENINVIKEDILGRDVRTIASIGNLIDDSQKVSHILEKGESWQGESKYIGQNGKTIFENIRINPIKDNNGEITHYVSIVEDITETKEKEQKIRLLSNAIDNSPRSVAVTDQEFKILYANSKLLELHNLTMEQVIGMEIKMLGEKAELYEHSHSLEYCVANGLDWYGELRMEATDGRITWAKLSINPIFDDNGKITNYLSIREDITEKKSILQLYEEERKKAKQLAEVKSKFLSNMSHEIRTPLNGIIGLINILTNENPRDDQKEYLQLLNFSSDHLLALINNILDLNKIDDGKLELENQDKDFKIMLENLVKTSQIKALEKGIELNLEWGKDLHRFYFFDKTRMTQIFSNLINNAIKFTDKGGVSIEVTPVKNYAKKALIRCEIKDTGIGIKHNRLEQIFERFSQADASIVSQYGGSGLGLAITRKLLQLMDSEIDVMSKVGKGTTFYFDLMLKKGVGYDEVRKTETKEEDCTLCKLKILSVDDNLVNQLITEKYIIEWGANIQKAGNGHEALEKITNHKFDLILMDIQMPGLNGLETSKRIRSMNGQYYKQVPIVAVSASAEQRQKELAEKAGMNHYLTKPYHPDDLKKIIANYSRIPITEDKNRNDNNTFSKFSIQSSILEKQIDEFSADNVEFKIKLIDSFFEVFDDLKMKFTNSLKTNDLEGLREVHHKNKSTIIMLKLDELNSIIEKGKAKLRNENHESKRVLILELNEHLKGLKKQLLQIKINSSENKFDREVTMNTV